MTHSTLAEARLVPDHDRLAFLPKHFGIPLMLRGEISVYNWLDRLSQEYSGGSWHYYEIPNGFYMAPADYETLHIVWPMNWCDRTMSADAAGIVATLYALCELCSQYRSDDLAEKYHALRDFAGEHAEANAIFAAID
ncbi:MAG: antirestriction protein [Achromobacter sp.]|uniref:antirestriction protein n=1 Tax=Achromobacter sp. TaxID=134375 RepID=UPI0012D2339F|nr:antirestriction protein [Achromobacter sp.]MPS82400.1 antirestriction protein [Achromobacter sp.]